MVVATRNGRPHIERLLDGLSKDPLPLLRVGGGRQRSTDGTLELLAETHPSR